MNLLERSWGSLSRDLAARYLKTYGYPSLTSKQLVVDVLEELALEHRRSLAILDLGCGNAQIYEYFKERRLPCTYTGVDFSVPLLEVARQNHAGDEAATFMADDIVALQNVHGRYDVVLYSHVLEMVSSPGESLRRARDLAPIVVIRFFEPPEFEEDTVELRELEVDEGPAGRKMPYLRWKMSRDHYRLILARLGCLRVDIYRDGSSTDQVHVLRFT
jgi:SAM-dependent methyltransferase